MELKEKIKAIVAEMLEVNENEINEEVGFEEYGLDSFMALELVAMLESEMGIHIDESLMSKLTSVNATVDIVTKIIEEQ